MTNQKIDRRKFIKQAALAGAAIGLTPYASRRVLGANDRVRIGIIGCGDRGQEDLREILKIPNVEFVAAADVFNRRHDEARQLAPGVKTFTDHRRLLELKEVDAVIVASPLHCHARHFIDTIEACKDRYSEKTMTLSVEEPQASRDPPRKPHPVVQIVLQHRRSDQI